MDLVYAHIASICAGCCGFIAIWVLIQTPALKISVKRSVSPVKYLQGLLRAAIRFLGSQDITYAAIESLGAEDLLKRLGRAINQTKPYTAQEAGACAALSVLGCSAVLLCVTEQALSCFLSPLIVGGVCFQILKRYEERIDRQRRAAMPEVFRSFSVALSSGKSLNQAVCYVAERCPLVLQEQFSRASYLVEMGSPLDDALADITHDKKLPGGELLGFALTVSKQTGCPLSSLFEQASQSVEKSHDLERELFVKTSQARLSAKIVAGLPLALLLGITLLSADFRSGLATPLGMGCALLGIVIDFVGLIIVRTLLNVEV